MDKNEKIEKNIKKSKKTLDFSKPWEYNKKAYASERIDHWKLNNTKIRKNIVFWRRLQNGVVLVKHIEKKLKSKKKLD